MLASHAEDVASETSENRRFRLPHCRWTPPLHSWEPREYPHKHYCQKLESLGYISVVDSMDLFSFKFSW